LSIEKEILDSIAILIKKSAESNTQIYIGTVTNLSGTKCSMLLNGKVLENVRYYGSVPPVGSILPVFVPNGNFNVAFTIYPKAADSGSTTGAVTSVAGKTGDVTLNKSDVGLSNVANVLQYSASNPPPYPVKSVNGETGDVELTIPDAYTLPVANSTTLGGVKPSTKTDAMTQDVGVDASGKLYTAPTEAPVQSVNGKTGAVSLTASDVGALPSSTTIPTKTSQLENDSSFITASGAPVQSVNSKTGAVQLSASDVNAVPISGGTMTGDLNVGTNAKVQTNGYITGTWLRTTADTHLASTPTKVAVINDGWIYDRTPAELKADIGVTDYVLPVASPTTLGGVQPVARTPAMLQKVGVDSDGKLYTESMADLVVLKMTYAEDDNGAYVKFDRMRSQIFNAVLNSKKFYIQSTDVDDTYCFYADAAYGFFGIKLLLPYSLKYINYTGAGTGSWSISEGETVISFDGTYDSVEHWNITPSSLEIPIATSTTVGGVKPIAKTSEMTQTVGVDADGRLYTTPGDSGTGVVSSVNGQTGVVVLNASDVGALPDTTTIPSKTSQLKNDSGFITSAPVQSVNGKTGVVSLSASDVNALPSTTTIPSKTSQLTNDSGFLTSAPVASVNGKTGTVTLTQDDVGNGSTYVRTHNDFTDTLKTQIGTNATAIAGKQAKITASGILKGDGNGGVSAAVSGTDYAPADSLVVSATQPTSQSVGGMWYKLGNILS